MHIFSPFGGYQLKNIRPYSISESIWINNKPEFQGRRGSNNYKAESIFLNVVQIY